MEDIEPVFHQQSVSPILSYLQKAIEILIAIDYKKALLSISYVYVIEAILFCSTCFAIYCAVQRIFTVGERWPYKGINMYSSRIGSYHFVFNGMLFILNAVFLLLSLLIDFSGFSLLQITAFLAVEFISLFLICALIASKPNKISISISALSTIVLIVVELSIITPPLFFWYLTVTSFFCIFESMYLIFEGFDNKFRLAERLRQQKLLKEEQLKKQRPTYWR